MRKNAKHEMRKRARAAMGIVNLLKDDIDQVRVDVTDFDMICLEESLRDTKLTIQMLVDSITEIEYMLYMYKAREN